MERRQHAEDWPGRCLPRCAWEDRFCSGREMAQSAWEKRGQKVHVSLRLGSICSVGSGKHEGEKVPVRVVTKVEDRDLGD